MTIYDYVKGIVLKETKTGWYVTEMTLEDYDVPNLEERLLS